MGDKRMTIKLSEAMVEEDSNVVIAFFKFSLYTQQVRECVERYREIEKEL
jgi:hypothetical protein